MTQVSLETARNPIDLVIDVLSRIGTTDARDTAKVDRAATMLAGVYAGEESKTKGFTQLGKAALERGDIIRKAPGGGLLWKWSDMRSTLFVLRWARGLPTKLLPEERRALDTVIAELEVMVPARRFEGPLTSFEFVEHSLFMMKGDPPFNAARDTTVRILEMIMDAAEAPKDSKGGMVTTGWSMRDMETTLHVLAVLRTSYTGEELPADSPFGSERVTPKPHPELAKWIAAVDHVIAAVEGWKTHSIRLPKGGTA